MKPFGSFCAQDLLQFDARVQSIKSDFSLEAFLKQKKFFRCLQVRPGSEDLSWFNLTKRVSRRNARCHHPAGIFGLSSWALGPSHRQDEVLQIFSNPPVYIINGGKSSRGKAHAMLIIFEIALDFCHNWMVYLVVFREEGVEDVEKSKAPGAA